MKIPFMNDSTRKKNRLNYQRQKQDIPDENLSCYNRKSVKVMVSAGLTWHGVLQDPKNLR